MQTATPTPTSLYRLFSGDDLLYVGVSGRWTRRLGQHAQKDWFRQITSVRVEYFESRDEALKTELAAIRRESPRYNILGASDPVAGPVDSAGLLGSWFLSGLPQGWQGQVVDEVCDGVYFVQLYSWSWGEPSVRRLVWVSQMEGWDFYASDEAMRSAQEARWDREGFGHRAKNGKKASA